MTTTPESGHAISAPQTRSAAMVVKGGGTRSERGTDSKMTLASLFGTWRVQGLNPLTACRQLPRSPRL